MDLKTVVTEQTVFCHAGASDGGFLPLPNSPSELDGAGAPWCILPGSEGSPEQPVGGFGRPLGLHFSPTESAPPGTIGVEPTPALGASVRPPIGPLRFAGGYAQVSVDFAVMAQTNHTQVREAKRRVVILEKLGAVFRLLRGFGRETGDVWEDLAKIVTLSICPH